jgi:hypothetical protein
MPRESRRSLRARNLLNPPRRTARGLERLGIPGFGLALTISGVAQLKTPDIAFSIYAVALGIVAPHLFLLLASRDGGIIQNERFGLARYSPFFRSSDCRFDQAGAVLAGPLSARS